MRWRAFVTLAQMNDEPNVDFIVDLAGELDVAVRVNGHRWWRDDPTRPHPS